jgi:nitrous oxidase accessory protein
MVILINVVINRVIGFKLPILLLFITSYSGLSVTHVYENINKGQSLQDIINKTYPGDTLLLKNCHFTEDGIKINKAIYLRGIDGSSLTGRKKDHIIRISSDNVTISGMIINGSGVSFVQDRAGIKLDSTRFCRIDSNTINGCMFAIHASASKNLIISNNIITGVGNSESSSGNGAHLWYCDTVNIINNRISHQRDGIYLEFVKESFISGNTSELNLRYGLHFMFSHNAVYKNNTFRNNGSGVAVMYTHNVRMEKNIFRNNWGSSAYGLLLKDISKSVIIGNDFSENTTGIYAEGGGSNIVGNNMFRLNGWALRIMANSQGNSFKGNNFLGNTFDVSTNSNSNTNTFTMNYWDKYTGYDLNKDGVGDVPYHPVRLFSFIVEQNPSFMILLHSLFIHILEIAENILPTLTPDSLIDSQPMMVQA